MTIFDYVEDIEETYKFLMNKAKERNEEQLRAIRKDEEKKMRKTLEKKEDYIDYVLNEMTNKIAGEVDLFEAELDNIIEELENSFEENKENLVNSIIKKIGFDF